MNPDLPDPNAEKEARLTALLLGQLSPEEAESVRRELAANDQLATLFARLQKTIELVRDASRQTGHPPASTEPLRLSADKREALLAQFKTTRPKEFSTSTVRQPGWFVPLAAAAILLVLGIAASAFLVRTNTHLGTSVTPSSGVAAEKPEMAAGYYRKLTKPEGNADNLPGQETFLSLGERGRSYAGVPQSPAATARLADRLGEQVNGDSFAKRNDTTLYAFAPTPEPESLARVAEPGLTAPPQDQEAFRRRYGLPAEPPTATADNFSARIPAPTAKSKADTGGRSAGLGLSGGFGGGGFGGAAGQQPAPADGLQLNAGKPVGQGQLKDVDSYWDARTPAIVAGRPDQGVTSSEVPVLGDAPVTGLSFTPRPASRELSLLLDSDAKKLAPRLEADVRLKEGILDNGRKSEIENRSAAAADELGRQVLAGVPLKPMESLHSLSVEAKQERRELREFAETAASAQNVDSINAPLGFVGAAPARDKATDSDHLISGGAVQLPEARQQKELVEPVPELPAGPPVALRVTGNGVLLPESETAPEAKPVTPPPTPQPEIATADNPFSTFSLNVADVSFRLAAASLNTGHLPDPATIRSEEFINAFDYRDPEAAPNTPFAFASDRARYPFAHNRELLRFSIKTAAQGRPANQTLNLVLLMDNSGSMERADRVSILQQAIRVLGSQLQPQDKLSVVTFARNAVLRIDGAFGPAAGQQAAEVARQTPEGGTNLEEALRMGYQTAVRQYVPAGINRVILLTDGAANLGNVNAAHLKAMVEEHRKQGIALDCFGIGFEGYNDELLETLSRNGDGRYGFLSSPEEASTEFAAKLTGALQVAASDVKVQVEFNKDRVTSYRQIGYAKHQLTKEQFRDNTVDAAEISAAEAGNALYVVEVKPDGKGPLATLRVRSRNPATGQYSENEWPVPYTGAAAPLTQASPALRLAGTAAAFAEMLAGSPYAAEVTSDRLVALMQGVKEHFGADPRPGTLESMIRQAQALLGR